MKEQCEFCDTNDFASQVVFKSSEFYVIVPRKPRTAGHLMLVAKQHHQRMDEMSEIASKDMIYSLRHIVVEHEDTDRNFKGYNLLSNNGGVNVGQHVQHFHMHIFLRFNDEASSPFDVLSGKKEAASYSASQHRNIVEAYRGKLN